MATEARGLVGPATQRIASTGAPVSRVKSVCDLPTGICNGRSRLVHISCMPIWRSSVEYGASLESTSEMNISLPM